ncbi:MAG TPA: hypothetical protein VHM91_14350, partial [Verrucomicrobiales bacterium]|nr:hypothetical protein [Verrucomicrobiales bacterium]
WDPALPVPAIVALGCVLVVVACMVCLRGPKLQRTRRMVLLALRLAVIALICLLLMQPVMEESIPQRHPRRVALVALDASQSMQENDAPDNMRRIDAARKLLRDNGLDGPSPLGEVRLFSFSDTARPQTADGLAVLRPEGETTRFHESLGTVFGGIGPGENCVGLFVLSDGHDFEMTPAARTAQLARANRTPVYTIPFGKSQPFPDISVRMASWQPYTFVKQHVKLQAIIRSVSAGERVVRAELLREGKTVSDQRVTLAQDGEMPVNFEVFEETPGQYEYEIRVTTLPGERETTNNTTFTYLNVTASKLRVLLVEGEPGWDTTFLARALARNDRVDLDSLVSIGNGPPVVSRPAKAEGPFKTPQTAADFSTYAMIILGVQVDRVFKDDVLAALGTAVADSGVTVVMARGNPSDHQVLKDIAPADWLEGATGPVQLNTPRRRGEFLPVDVLATAPGGLEALPPLSLVHQTGKPRDLSGVEAIAGDPQSKSSAPAILHRRHGTGQVLSVAVEGLWKWALNAKSEPANNVFDRFWNQLLLNLLSRSAAMPSDKPQWTVSSANLTTGEKVTFNLHPAQGKELPKGLQAVIYRDNQKVAETPLSPLSKESSDQSASIVLEKAGRYRAAVEWPGEKLECRFAAVAEQKESTDTSLNLPYLRALADASGGKLLDAAALPGMIQTLERAAVAEATAPPVVRRKTIWDTARVFLLLAGLFGVEWFLRRRWGLT